MPVKGRRHASAAMRRQLRVRRRTRRSGYRVPSSRAVTVIQGDPSQLTVLDRTLSATGRDVRHPLVGRWALAGEGDRLRSTEGDFGVSSWDGLPYGAGPDFVSSSGVPCRCKEAVRMIRAPDRSTVFSSSTRRRAALCCLGVLTVTTTACSISDPPADGAGADDVSWLFSQTSDSGRLEVTDGEAARLVMNGVDLHTIMFADRPDRLTEVIDTATITEQWNEMFADSAPNAVLVEHRPDGEADSLVVVLRRPVLDTVAGTLSYNIEVLADEDHPDSIDGLVGDLHDDPPATFGAVSLFIDNAPRAICKPGYRSRGGNCVQE